MSKYKNTETVLGRRRKGSPLMTAMPDWNGTRSCIKANTAAAMALRAACGRINKLITHALQQFCRTQNTSSFLQQLSGCCCIPCWVAELLYLHPYRLQANSLAHSASPLTNFHTPKGYWDVGEILAGLEPESRGGSAVGSHSRSSENCC